MLKKICFPFYHNFPFQWKVMIKILLKNGEHCYVVEQRVVSKLSKTSIEDLYHDSVKISRRYVLSFPRIKPSNSVSIGSDRFIILNDSLSPKMIMKMYLDFFKRFQSFLHFIDATYIWLPIGTSFASLTRNYYYILQLYLFIEPKNIFNRVNMLHMRCD